MSFVPLARSARSCPRCFQKARLSTTVPRWPRRFTPFRAPAPEILEEGTSSRASDSASLPWYVDAEYLPIYNKGKGNADASASASVERQPAPADFPAHLLPAHDAIQELPFFSSTMLVNSESGAWPWSLVCTLRQGRERNIRSAAVRVKDEISSSVRSIRPELLKELSLEGVNVPEPSWALVDLSGEIVVHVLTPEAAAKYDLVSIGQQSDFDLLREFD